MQGGISCSVLFLNRLFDYQQVSVMSLHGSRACVMRDRWLGVFAAAQALAYFVFEAAAGSVFGLLEALAF